MPRAAKVALKLAITALLLGVVLAKADLASTRDAAARLGLPALAAGLAILFGLTAVQALRWRIVVDALGARLGFRRSWRYVLLGLFFSQFLPTSIGGDVIRVWKLHRDGCPAQMSFNSVVLDRLVALGAAVLITLAGAPLLARLFPQPGARLALGGFFVAAVAGFALLFAASRWQGLTRRIAALGGERIAGLYRAMVDDAARVFLAPRVAAAVLALSVLMHVAISAVVWLLAVDAGARLDFVTCVVVVPMVLLMSMLPVSIAGWGVREGAMLVALGASGVEAGIALTTSIVFGVLLAMSSLPGVPAWLYERRHA